MRKHTAMFLGFAMLLSGCSLFINTKSVEQSLTKYMAKTHAVEPSAYAVNEKKNKVLYAVTSTTPAELYLYNPRIETAQRIRGAHALPGVDKITYAEGTFLVWYQGNALVEVIVERNTKRPVKVADVAKND